MKPPTRLHQTFEVDDIEMKPPTSKFEVAVRVRGIDRNGQPYFRAVYTYHPIYYRYGRYIILYITGMVVISSYILQVWSLYHPIYYRYGRYIILYITGMVVISSYILQVWSLYHPIYCRYGRYITTIIGTVGNIIVSVSAAFIPTYPGFVICRFLNAMTGTMAYLGGFVLGEIRKDTDR